MASKTRGKGEGSVYLDSRGYWTIVVELPSHDGKRRRKAIRSKSKKVALDNLRELMESLRQRGDLPTTDQTVEQWMTYWVEHVAAAEVRPKTLGNYRMFVNNHIIPTIGTIRMSKVAPMHVRRVADNMTNVKNLAPSTVLTAHRIMSASFETAMRENRIPRNPAKLMSAPRKNAPDLDVLTLEEGIDLYRFLITDEQMAASGARWATSLLTGMRRGEVLGLEADRIGSKMEVSWQLQRLIWAHGCGDKTSAGFRCGCVKGTGCPERRLNLPKDYEYRHLEGGLYLTRPKSKAGWRMVPLVPPLRGILEQHMEANPPGDNGLLFTNKGRPLDPDQDSKNWRALLPQAGITKNIRLHDLRHTAVDLMFEARFPEDLIMEIVGHSSHAMTRAYKSRGNDRRLTAAMIEMGLLFTRPDDERSGMSAISA